MKRQLYAELTEREYYSIAQPGQPLPIFNHEYAQRRRHRVACRSARQWQRGCEYLRIAAHGLPLQAATLYIQIAQAHEKHGDKDGMWQNYQNAMQIGRSVGVQNLQPADKEALFATVKKIGEQAVAEKQLDAALEAFKFYSQNENAGIETYRVLADLFEQEARRLAGAALLRARPVVQPARQGPARPQGPLLLFDPAGRPASADGKRAQVVRSAILPGQGPLGTGQGSEPTRNCSTGPAI